MRRRWFALLLFIPVLLFATTTGPNFPTAATGNTAVIGGGTVNWVNPGNITANDGTFATAAMAGTTSRDLIGSGFGFAIAGTDTINGILLEVNYKSLAGTDAAQVNVRLLKAGVATGADKSTGALLPAAATTVSFGGAADLWAAAWTPADINAANFGAAFVTAAAGDTASVDFFRITITSTGAGTSPRHHRRRGFQPGTAIRTQIRTMKAA